MLEFQHGFINAVLNKDVEPNIFVPYIDLEARIDVYRRNFMQGYGRALKKTFSMTAKYLGDAFEEAAVSYVCANRPKAGQLFVTYGHTFPSHLQDPVAEELARLEWDLQTILIGREDVKLIGNFPDNPDGVMWQLRSDVVLFQSKYSIGHLYLDLINGHMVNGLPSLHPSYYLLYRLDESPIILPINEYEFIALTQLVTPHTVGELFDKLTFSKEIFVSLLSKIFNINFLKVAYVNDSSNT
jgi:hypothetical protein